MLNSVVQPGGRPGRGLSLLEMLVAMAIVGMAVAATYRSLGDSAVKTADWQMRQRAWLLLEGLLYSLPDQLPGPLPQQERRGDLVWRLERVDAGGLPQPVPLHAELGVVPLERVQPVAVRYTVSWEEGKRSISVVTWRVVPSASP